MGREWPTPGRTREQREGGSLQLQEERRCHPVKPVDTRPFAEGGSWAAEQARSMGRPEAKHQQDNGLHSTQLTSPSADPTGASRPEDPGTGPMVVSLPAREGMAPLSDNQGND